MTHDSQPIVLSEPLSLLPVLEFEPGDYSTQARDLPETKDRQGWDAYWRASLLDSGLKLEPIGLGSWFVAVDSLTDMAVIEQLCRHQLRGTGIEGFPDDTGSAGGRDPDLIPMLAGGYVLCERKSVGVLEPTCCCDLSNLGEWAQAAAWRRQEVAELWIGHPACSYWYEHDTLFIREQTEYPTDEVLRTFALSAISLERAVAEAQKELGRFRRRLWEALANLLGDPEWARVVADCLVGDHDEE